MVSRLLGRFSFGRILLLCIWLGVPGVRAQGDAGGSLPQVQAKFLLSFVAFTTWPDSSQGADAKPVSRTIGVLGDDFGALAIEELVAARPGGTGPSFTVRRIRQTDDLDGCDVLLVGEGYDEAKWNAAFKLLRSRPVLTVGVGRVFAQRQGLVGLYLKDGRLRFAVNFKRLEPSGLTMSSRLLGLAEIVEE